MNNSKFAARMGENLKCIISLYLEQERQVKLWRPA